MPCEHRYDKDKRLIYARYSGNLTVQEYLEGLAGEKEFFEGMSGLVGVIADVSALKSVAPGVLLPARQSQLARYRSLIIVVLGTNVFSRSITEIFARLTGNHITFLATNEEALAYIQAALARK
jgi:hypothetical protein